jgi:hypothetical protein
MITMEDVEQRLAIDVGGVLRRRGHRLKALLDRRRPGTELAGYLDHLVTSDRLTFAVEAITANLHGIDPADEPRSEARAFPGWFIAVTVVPGREPAELRHRPGGYLGLLADFTAPAYQVREGRHVAHWIVGIEGGSATVRLAVIPNHRISDAPLLLPMDLLAPGERDLLRLPRETAAVR